MVTTEPRNVADSHNKEHEDSADAKRITIVDENGNVISTSNPLPVDTELTLDGNVIINNMSTTIKDPDTGLEANVIVCDGHNALVSLAPGHVSTVNSTSTTLNSGATFTGTYEDVTNFGVIVVTLKASHASATDGLEIQFSSDGVNVDSQDNFTIAANTGKTFSFQTATKFYRIVYTNGGTNQTFFRLQTVLKPYYVKPSSHRVDDNISGQDDAELIKAVITGKNPGGTFVNITTTTAGNLKFSLEEYDDAAIPVRKDIEGGWIISVGTSAVEVTFTVTTKHILITARQHTTRNLFIV